MAKRPEWRRDDQSQAQAVNDLAVQGVAASRRRPAATRGCAAANLRLLSARDSTFKYDFRSEDASGTQDPALSVFTRDASGTLRHFYTTHPWLHDDMNERGIDLLQPV
jgi:hypothetical protein